MKVRADGYALNDEESNLGIRGVAVPIRDHSTNSVIAAIAIVAPVFRLSPARAVDLVPMMLKAAEDLRGISYLRTFEQRARDGERDDLTAIRPVEGVLKMRTIETDVIVMGAGAAGTYAALRLNEAGIRTLVVCKGMIGKSGATIFAGSMILAGRMLDGTQEESSAATEFWVRWYNHFLVDQEFVRKAEKWIEETYYPGA